MPYTADDDTVCSRKIAILNFHQAFCTTVKFCAEIMEIGTTISSKIKTAIKSKLVEFGSYIDDELPDYIMVMVANKRSQEQMSNDLNLFLGENSTVFCEWLHDLLKKLQEVTEGAFEVKVPISIPLDSEVKTKIKTEENESLKISKLSRKPSPIRMTSDLEDPIDNQDDFESSTYIKGKLQEKDQKKERKNSGLLQSALVVQKRPVLPASQQANINLLKKAMHAVQGPVHNVDRGEYNPEAPATAEISSSNTDPESKKRQLEYLLEEHKKLQRLKSQQEDIEESLDPVIELQAAEDDELFNTDEIPLTKDRRIVVDKSDSGSETENSKHEKRRKDKKAEKRKLEDEKSDEDVKPGSDDEAKILREAKQSVKNKEKKRKPKFIVTLEGVSSEFEAKYEKEKKRKRHRSTGKEGNKIEPPSPGVQMIPVFPPMLIQDGQHVAIIPPVQHINSVIPAPQIMSTPAQVVPLTVMTPTTETTTVGQVDVFDEDGDVEMLPASQEKCRFWPQCKNGDDCPYDHPGETCKHFPNCRYGRDCAFLHPPCKFGSRCTSSSCSFSHTSTSPENSTTLCRYHPFCTRSDCPFSHPSEKPCRYGAGCTRPGCPFSHSVPPPREQLKWVAPKPHVSDRQFAVNEANTAPLKVQ